MDKRWLPLILLFAALIALTIFQFTNLCPPKEPKAVPMVEKNKKCMTFLEFPSLGHHENKFSRSLTRKYKKETSIQIPDNDKIKETDGRVRMEK